MFFKTLLIGHFIADFYLQTNKMAEQKKNNRILLLHVFLYSLTITICFFVFTNATVCNLFIVFLISFISHFAVDKFKIKVDNNSFAMFIVDQAVHIFLLFIIAVLFAGISTRKVFAVVSNLNSYISLMLTIIFICEPTGVLIKKAISKFQPVASDNTSRVNDDNQEIENAGKWIGILERMLIFMMLLTNEYSSIGLVITAKSIVRYNKLVENKSFSEYYLIGTLLSTLIVIVVYVLVCNFEVLSI